MDLAVSIMRVSLPIGLGGGLSWGSCDDIR